ncbi:MAG: aminopeptidase [Clostridia bacterium]
MEKNLLINKEENGFMTVSEKVIEKADKFCENYKVFLNVSKTEREATSYAVARAEEKGFVEFDPEKKYIAGDKVYYNNREKSICLAVIGKNGCKDGVRISAAHIDSPRIDLKPIPLFEKNEMAMLKTHYYGGIKKFQWLTIPLAMHGVIVKKDGTVINVCIGEKEGEPQFCITDILPHLGKDQSAKTMASAVNPEDMNILFGSRPVREEDAKEAYKLNAMRLLNEKYDITEADLISAEIEFVPATKAVDIGFDRSLIGSYGHDDRVCAYPALEAIFKVKNPESTIITVLADKEEIGSQGNTGLQCEYLKHFISDLAEQEGLKPRHVIAKSMCLSADVTAAYDPNHAYAYDPLNSCYINHGAGFAKYTGSRGKSGSSDANAEFVAKIRKILDDAEVVWQIGELGKVDQGGGGTVAAMIANMNMDVIDIGVPVLSMHAPFEVVSKLDVFMTYKAIKAFYEA